MIDRATHPTGRLRIGSRAGLGVLALTGSLLLTGCFAAPSGSSGGSTTSSSGSGSAGESSARIRVAHLLPPR